MQKYTYLPDPCWFLPAVLLFTLVFVSIICSLCRASEMDLTRAVIHHTASHDVSAAEIDRWHKERGWDGIGYHYIIRANGKIEKGRDINKKGAHAKGRNHLIGIALTGNDEFTPRQISNLKELLRRLKIVRIERHHQHCPGQGIDVEKMQRFINRGWK